ncbi:glycosyltransferase family 4 protein [Roseobacter sp. N2S]|uniref:glycosyltransferase family 4 protein n=1 Tax=Roseobacter sp. N2S TaxID=2663844 RepID=UPI00285FD7D3|nr:glycosyltransferase family 4 protein [Roseobacter sp. N2S]MDR6266713.1 glycosyltransferase involved in cell wall biosynthesis [Roseobacter sp. N2S]
MTPKTHSIETQRTAPQNTVPQKIIVIASLGYSLVNFRLELLKRMVANGHQVLALAPEFDTQTKEILARCGIEFALIPMDRVGMNPIKDFRLIVALNSIFRGFRPDAVLAYTAKPIIYGSLVGRMQNVRRRFALFTGLGYAFSSENPTGKNWLARFVSIALYRLATKGMVGAFAYNPKEIEDLRAFRLLPACVPVLQVPGSGVDTSLFKSSTPPIDPIKFIMVARLLKSKGVEILVEAGRRLREKGYAFELSLLGPEDTNPDAIPPDVLADWIARKDVVYLGVTKDVRPFLAQASVLVLPSMYREGLPRSILEAMSSGRAVITSDAPGCADSITGGRDGFIVRAGSPDALAEAMERFLLDPELVRTMGAAGRKHACDVFDVHKVNKILLTKMGLESPLAGETTW